MSNNLQIVDGVIYFISGSVSSSITPKVADFVSQGGIGSLKIGEGGEPGSGLTADDDPNTFIVGEYAFKDGLKIGEFIIGGGGNEEFTTVTSGSFATHLTIDPNDPTSFYISGSNISASIYVSSSGKLGFGTTNPEAEFDIRTDDFKIRKRATLSGIRMNEDGNFESFNNDTNAAATGSEIILKYTRGAVKSGITDADRLEELQDEEFFDKAIVQADDVLGSIRFVADSGSLDERVGGEAGNIKMAVATSDSTGVTGKLSINLAADPGAVSQQLYLINGATQKHEFSGSGGFEFQGAITATTNAVIGSKIIHQGDTNNFISFGTDTQDYQTGGSSRLDISNSGVRLGGANARVTTILDEDNMASDSATSLATQQSIKAYVDANAGGGGSVSGNTFATDLKIGRDADNLIDFTTDNQVTFRVSANDGVVMKASGEIEATSLDISGNITVGGDLIHSGDTDTKISFTDDDINIQVGGVNFIDLTEGSPTEITFNEAGAASSVDIDFRVEGTGDANLLFTDAGNDKVGIGTNTPEEKLTVTGNISASGEVITTEVSSLGDFTLDVAGDITLDTDGADIILSDGGTNFGRFKRDTSDFVIKSETNDKDIIFKGVDNSSTITALTLDMSAAGEATFNNVVNCTALNTGQGDYELFAMDQNVDTAASVTFAGVEIGSEGTLEVRNAGTFNTSAAQNLAIIQGAASNIDIGAFELRAQTLQSDVATGTAPFTVASNTQVTNLHAATASLAKEIEIYYTWEATTRVDSDDDDNWQGPNTKGILTMEDWTQDYGTDYDDTSSTNASSRTHMNTGWWVPHGANYSASIKSMDIYVQPNSNITYADADTFTAALWYSHHSDLQGELNVPDANSSTFIQRHGASVDSSQFKAADEKFFKYNNYHVSKSIDLDLAPGSMVFPRMKTTGTNDFNMNVYWVIHYCKIPL